MIKSIQIGGVILLALILVILTAIAVKDILRNDMMTGDNFFTFMDYFKTEYAGLYTIWNVIIGIVFVVFLYFFTLMIRG